MEPAVRLAYLAAGAFFLTALVTGVWKYAWMARSDDHQAPYYVNTAHRASLLYSFAAILLAEFARLSTNADLVDLAAVAVVAFFFAFAIGSYVLHGLLRDTDNQFATPHVLGPLELPPVAIHGAMVALIVGEIGGFLVLFAGALPALL